MEQVSQAQTSSMDAGSTQADSRQASSNDNQPPAFRGPDAAPRDTGSERADRVATPAENQACSVDGLLSKSISTAAGRDKNSSSARDTVSSSSLRDDALRSAADINKRIGHQSIKQGTADLVKSNVLPEVVIS